MTTELQQQQYAISPSHIINGVPIFSLHNNNNIKNSNHNHNKLIRLKSFKTSPESTTSIVSTKNDEELSNSYKTTMEYYSLSQSTPTAPAA